MPNSPQNLKIKKYFKISKFVAVFMLLMFAAQILMPLGALATHDKDRNSPPLHAKGLSNPTVPDSDAFDELEEAAKKVYGDNYRNFLSSLVVIEGRPDVIKEQIQKVKDMAAKGEKAPPNAYQTPTHENPRNALTGECDVISLTGGVNLECIIGRSLAWIGYKVLQISSLGLAIMSGLFNASAELSLSYSAYSRNTATAVYLGWRAVRDFINILFIFIILVIAISLILQIQQYGSQKILLSLVGVALLINFSFFITQQIINVSNSAALFFKKSITGESDSILNLDLASFFVNQLNPQQFLTGYQPNLSAINPNDVAAIEKMNKEIKSSGDISILAIIVSTFGGIAVILAASFVLFAAALMFLARTIVLWNLMILAPAAFLFFVLPGARGSFQTWWKRLLNESFFAPIMLFMFYIDMRILQSGFIQQYVASKSVNTVGESVVFNYYLMMQYTLVILLLVKCLWVAKSFGAYGSDWMVKQWDKGLKKVTGGYGKKPFYAAGRAARSTVSPVAEKVLTTESKGLGRFYKMTGLKKGAEEIVARTKGDIDKEKNKLGKLSSKELSTKFKTSFGPTSSNENMAIMQLLQERDDLNMVGPEYLEKMHKRQSKLGISTKSIETWMPSLTGDNAERREKAVQRETADKTLDYLRIGGEFDFNASNPKNRDLYLKTWGEGHLKEMYKGVSAGDDSIMPSAKNLLQGYVDKYGADMDKIVNGLEQDNNHSAARFLKTAEGERMFQGMISKANAAMPTAPPTPTPKRGTYAAKAQAKEDLQLEDEELVKNVILGENKKLNATDEGKERIFEIVRQADDKRLGDILYVLQMLAATERKELLQMMAKKDIEKGTDEAKSVININPTIINEVDAETKDNLGLANIKQVVDQIPIKDTRFLAHDALMNPEVITALSPAQLSDIAENKKNLTNEEITEIIRIINERGMEEVKDYIIRSGSPVLNPAGRGQARERERRRATGQFEERGGI